MSMYTEKEASNAEVQLEQLGKYCTLDELRSALSAVRDICENSRGCRECTFGTDSDGYFSCLFECPPSDWPVYEALEVLEYVEQEGA